MVALVDEVVRPVRLDRGRAVGERLLDVEHDGQVLVGDLHRAGALERGLLARGDHGDDRLALVEDAVLGQHRLVVRLDADEPQDRVPVGRHVGVREHLDDAGDGERRRDVDRLEQRVVALGARHLEVQEAGRVAVLEELRAAGDVAERVRALDRRADDVEVVVAPLGEVGAVDLLGLDRHQTPPSTYWIPPAAVAALRRVEDRVDDRLVARAAADVARDRADDVLAARVRVLREQRLRGHDHAARAEAALGGEALEERGLELVELAAVAGDALERAHVGALDRLDRHEAAHHRLAVDEAGAGAARALRAAALGGGEAELLAQRAQQRRARLRRGTPAARR